MGLLKKIFGMKDMWADKAPRSTPAPARQNGEELLEVANRRGDRRVLGEEISRGGEGRVFAFKDSDLIAKIYHRKTLANPDRIARLESKISAMTQLRDLAAHPNLAWPRVSLYDPRNGRWIGYAMRRLGGVSMQGLLGAPAHLARHAPDWGRLDLVELCLDFLLSIKSLAKHRALPVDFNPCNFLVDAAQRRVNFIDCDGYQVQGADRLYLCEALRPDFAPVELLDRARYDEAPATPASLRFSVAMILFYILNVGNTPYRHLNGADPVSNLRSGECALGIGADCLFPRGRWMIVWSHLPYRCKTLFIRCFRDGHSQPDQRPSVDEWIAALRRYRELLRSGQACNDILPAARKPSEKDSSFFGNRRP